MAAAQLTAMNAKSLTKDRMPLAVSEQSNRPVSQTNRGPPLRPVWKEKTDKPAHALSEENWPAAVPTKSGKPTLGLSLQGKAVSPKPGSKSSPVGPARIREDPPTVSMPGEKGDKENCPLAEVSKEPSAGLNSKQRRRKHYREVLQSRKRAAAGVGSGSGAKLAKMDPSFSTTGAGAAKHPKSTPGAGAAKHLKSTPGAGAAKHLKSATGAGAAKHQKSSKGAGAKKHLKPDTEASAAKHSAAKGGASAAKHLKSKDLSSKSSQFSLKVTDKRLISQEMLPSSCYEIVGHQVRYFRDGVSMEFTREYKVDKVKRDITYPIRPVHVVDQLVHPTLLVPGADLPSEVRSNPRMLLLPQLKAAVHHSSDGAVCQCVCNNILGRYHREAALPDCCLRGKQLVGDNMRVSPPEMQLQENPSRHYVKCELDGDSYLAVPTPFPVGGSWPTLRYEPVMAGWGKCMQADIYSALYDPSRFREVASTYQRSPSERSASDLNPVISEASTSDEVGLIAGGLYGLETIPRVGFTAHPAAEPVILVFPAMDRLTRKVPVFLQDLKRPALLDTMMGDVFRPFWERGHGVVLCPVCLFEDKNGTPQPLYLSKSSFAQHWEKRHYSSHVVSGTFSATALHTRLYMGHVLYTLCWATRRMSDSPLQEAVSKEALKYYRLETWDSKLADLFPLASTCPEVMEVASATWDETGLQVVKPSPDVEKAAVDSARGTNTPAVKKSAAPVKRVAAPMQEALRMVVEKLESCSALDSTRVAAGQPASSSAVSPAVEKLGDLNALLIDRLETVSLEAAAAVLEDSSETDPPFTLVKGKSSKHSKRK